MLGVGRSGGPKRRPLPHGSSILLQRRRAWAGAPVQPRLGPHSPAAPPAARAAPATAGRRGGDHHRGQGRATLRPASSTRSSARSLPTARGHFSPINSVAFSPDGTAFVTGAEEGNVRLHHFDAGAWPRPRRRCGCRSRLRQLGSAGRAATFRPCPASLIVTCLPLPLPVQTTSRQTGTGSESSGRGLVATAAGTRRAAAALHAKPASRLRPVARFFAPPTHATFHVCFFQFCLHALLACHIASACLPVLGPGGAHQRRCPACTSSFRCQSAIFLLTSAHAFFTRM